MSRIKSYRLNQKRKKKYIKSAWEKMNEAFEQFFKVARACGYHVLGDKE